MEIFDAAKELYRDAKALLDATRDAAASNDEQRWAREDAEEDLLDLKLAVIDGSVDEVSERFDDVQRMIQVIFRIVAPPPNRLDG